MIKTFVNIFGSQAITPVFACVMLKRGHSQRINFKGKHFQMDPKQGGFSNTN